MKCPWCTGELGNKNIKEFNKSKVINHLVIIEDTKGNVHVHGPIENSFTMKKFIDAILIEVDKKNIKLELDKK